MSRYLRAALAALLLTCGIAASAGAAYANQTPAFAKPKPTVTVYQQATATKPRIIIATAANGDKTVTVQPLDGTVFNCDTNEVCLFDGTNYGTYHWAHAYFPSLMGTCSNLTDWSIWFTNRQGEDMNNTVSSVIVNPSSSYAGSAASVTFWPNANCAGTPRPYHVMGDGLGLDPDLTNGGFHISANWSNTLTSLRFAAS